MVRCELVIPGVWCVKPLGSFSHRKKTVMLGVMESFDRKARMPIVEAYKAVQTYNDTHSSKVRMIRPNVADSVLSDSDGEHWLKFMTSFKFPVDGALAYERIGRPLGDVIAEKRTDGSGWLVFPTGCYKSADGALLAKKLRYSDFRKDGKDTVLEVPDGRLRCVTDLPEKDGWYRMRQKRTVPSAEEGDEQNGRKFTRRDGAHVAPLMRDAVFSRFCIHANGSFFDRLWAVVEVVYDEMAASAASLVPRTGSWNRKEPGTQAGPF